MAYDPNGNLTKDLDRDIVTIRYNLLNLPEVIQFKNGNQLRNLYDASGQKLRTRSYTVYDYLQPIIAEGTTRDVMTFSDVYEEGTEYIGNVEYSLLYNYYNNGELIDGSTSAYSSIKLYNSEGFSTLASNVNYMSYYRRDHLGNNREVWRAAYINSRGRLVAAATEQRTQYYPSGLPWASNSGDNPGAQN